jgi:transcriptional regulator with XRE-family HTH domain
MKKIVARAFSERLKSMREAAGLSQQEVAMKADLSLSLVAKMEQGKKADPRASTVLALAGALNVKPGRLLDDLLPTAPPAGEVPTLATVPASAEEGGKKKKKKDKKKKKNKQPVA